MKTNTVSNCANLWVVGEHWLPNNCLGQKCSPGTAIYVAAERVRKVLAWNRRIG